MDQDAGRGEGIFLRAMAPEDIDQELTDMKVAEKAVTIIQKGFIRTVIHICRLVAGSETRWIRRKFWKSVSTKPRRK